MRRVRVLAIAHTAAGACAALLGASACAGRALPHDTPLLERARRLAREVLVVDTHIDVPYRLLNRWEDVSRRTQEGHFDYPRARRGGLDAAFFSIYVPASYQQTGGAKEHAEKLIEIVERLVREHPDRFALVRSPDEVRALHGTGRFGIALGMENGAPVGEDLGNIAYFHARGIRYITLAHSENNQICDSSYARERRWRGLSPLGRQVVREMNRVGIMVDISHVSDEAFYQVLEESRAPVIASHSSCRAFTPGWERNMDDAMIRALAEHGGVIQINFGSAFIRDDARRELDRFRDAFEAFLESKGLERGSPEAQAFRKDYLRDHPVPRGTVADVADHVDHVVQLVGVDHVGLGSDFDGVSTLPVGLEDVSGYPNLIAELVRRGYTEEAIRKICGENLLRVWSAVERVAREMSAARAG